jgi:serine/threonine protein kinase
MFGTALAHFQILEKLGAGGMGEVYKARDTRLNRLVAIKVLPRDKLTDANRKQRFIQEAQSASALNHPNIVTIHDINAERGVDYIVMEFIAGKTVDALIPRHGMRLSEVLRISIAVADGLAKAHAAGIVHRDIKPSNLMVADDGRVKILDFGLAKLTESEQSGEEDATLTQPPTTQEGIVLGTVAYMSPEQVEARKLDARSDIFSFGAVLYEMLSGRKAFTGASTMSTLSAILREDPVKPENLSPDVDRVLRRCLRKDPAKRFQHMDDLKVALEELRDESESGALAASPEAVKPRRNIWAIPLISLLVLGAVAAAILGIRRSGTGGAPSESTVQLRRLTADAGLTTTPDLSRDGKLLAYASDRGTDGNLDLWVQPLSQGARPIRLTTNSTDDSEPTFSPDGGEIAFISQRDGGGIYVIPALGGEERLVIRGGFSPRFSPDGKWIAYCSGSGPLGESKLFIVSAAGGTPRQVGADVGWGFNPVWSPDGAKLLFKGMDAPNVMESAKFWLASVEGGKSIPTNLHQLLSSEKIDLFGYGNVDWSGSSPLFVGRFPGGSSEARSVDLDVATGVAGNLRRLASSTSWLRHVRGSVQRFVVTAETEAFHLWKLPFDVNTGRSRGSLEAIPHSGGQQLMPSSSLDGRVLAYLQDTPSTQEVHVRFENTKRDSVLIAKRARPKVSPDGTKVAFSYQTASSGGGAFLVEATGGQVTTLLEATQQAIVYGWTADGNDIVFWNGSPIRFSLFNLRTQQESVLLSHPRKNIHDVELSPDRQWAAFHLINPESGPLLVTPVREGKAAGEAEWFTIADYPGKNRRPWWSPDGNLLYFVSDRDGKSCIWAQRLAPSSKRPQGEAFPVSHFHQARLAITEGTGTFGPAVSRDALVFRLLERSGDIWIGEKRTP